MGISKINVLYLNPFLSSRILYQFLRGYNKPIKIDILFYILPIIYFGDSRKKLIHARKKSTIYTMFGGQQSYLNDTINLNGKINLAGFKGRFNMLYESCQQAIIILFNEKKIVINDDFSIELIETKDCKSPSTKFNDYLIAADHLGIIMAQSTDILFKDYLKEVF